MPAWHCSKGMPHPSFIYVFSHWLRDSDEQVSGRGMCCGHPATTGTQVRGQGAGGLEIAVSTLRTDQQLFEELDGRSGIELGVSVAFMREVAVVKAKC